MWPPLDDTLRPIQDVVRSIDTLQIPEYVVQPYLDTIHATGTYYPTRHRKACNPFSRLIRKAKRGDQRSLDTLCFLIADFLSSTIGTLPPIDLILHVPTDAQRLKERGFSIPEALARAVSRRLGVPICECLVLNRPVKSLRGLLPEERVAELSNAFAVSNPAQVEKKRILLVDDVVAYGTTIARIASLLRGKGVEGVSVAVLAYAART